MCGKVVISLVFALSIFNFLGQFCEADCGTRDIANNEVGLLQVCDKVDGDTSWYPLCAEPTPEKTASVFCRATLCDKDCNQFNFTTLKRMATGLKYQCEAGENKAKHCKRTIEMCNSIITTLNCECSLTEEKCPSNYTNPNYCSSSTCSCTPGYDGDNCTDSVCEIGKIKSADPVRLCGDPFGEHDWFPVCPSHDLSVIRSLCRSKSSCRTECNQAQYTFQPPDNDIMGYDVTCNDTADGLSQCELSYGNCTTGVLSMLECIENTTCQCSNGGFCYDNGACLCPGNYTGDICETYILNTVEDPILVRRILFGLFGSILILLCICLCTCVISLIVYIKSRPTDLQNLEKRIIFTTLEPSRSVEQEDALYTSVKLEEMTESIPRARDNRYSDVASRSVHVAEYMVCNPTNQVTVVPVVANETASRRDRCYTQQASVDNDIYNPVIPASEQGDTSNIVSSPKIPHHYCSSVVLSHKQRVEKKKGELLKEGESYFAKKEDFMTPPTDVNSIYNTMSELKFREINSDCISLQRIIGTGCFGMVHLAEWKIEQDTAPISVAVKLLKENADSQLRISFLTEAATMGQFNHPNVVRLLGIVSITEPYMLVVELMEGDLNDLLTTISSVPFNSESVSQYLLSITRDVVRGMKYLSSKHFIHRDLAARNVLVGSDKKCKIGDFGLAKWIDDDKDYYKVKSGGMVAVRWAAAEALFYRRYSEKSDVWSFGMTLFEIWSLGQKPWPQYSNVEVIGLVSNNTLQGPPTGCPYEIYSLMAKTWRINPSERPTFREIAQFFEQENAILLRIPEELKYEKAGQLGNDPILSASLFPELRD